MQPAEFDYHRPADLGEALDLLSRLDDARPLAGGQSLLPAMKMRLSRPGALVDLGRVAELSGIRRDGDALRACLSRLLGSRELWEECRQGALGERHRFSVDIFRRALHNLVAQLAGAPAQAGSKP